MTSFAYHASLLSSSGPERTSAQQTGQYEQVQVAFTACRWHLQGRWQANCGIVRTVIQCRATSLTKWPSVMPAFDVCLKASRHVS